MSDVLARICADKRSHIARQAERVSLAELERRVARAEAPRGFRASLERRIALEKPALIAEIKKASPSKGLIRADFDPPSLARAYREGGAACLSVLTDEPYFQGNDAYLAAAREASGLPVLRKDFILDPYQVTEARAIGADCVLLIMACLDVRWAKDLAGCAHDLGMDVLIEVHDEAELRDALAIDADLFGINNRNLKTLEIDLATTERLAPLVPEDRMLVAESGIYGPVDIERLEQVGARCFLVGESLMRQEDVATATRTLLGGTGR